MDDRRGQDDAPDEAVFTPAPLRAGGRPPVFLAGAALVIVVLVGAATLDRLGGDRPRPAAFQPLATASAGIPADTAPPARTSRPRPPGLTVVPALIRIDVRPDGRHLFVHGDVFSLEAFIVVVSLEDQGVVTDTQTVNMPGGSTAFLTDANPRFYARFDMPRRAPAGSVWVRASAYDTRGDLVVSLRQPVPTAAT
jgi:hypothetical protein